MSDNKSALKISALSLFATKGYDAVGVKEIVDTCSVTKPTLYHYFGSKKGLFQEILEEEFTNLFSKLEPGFTYRHDIVNSLNILAGLYLHYAGMNKDFLRLMNSLSFLPEESEAASELSPYLEKLYRRLETLFVQAAEDHGNMKGRQESYALAFLGMLNAQFSLMLRNSATVTDDLIFRAVHQFMHGIFS